MKYKQQILLLGLVIYTQLNNLNKQCLFGPVWFIFYCQMHWHITVSLSILHIILSSAN